MNERNTMENVMETLLESESWYVISPFHCVYGSETSFEELEHYLLENFLHTFCEKVSRIALKLMGLYSAYVELTEFFPEAPLPPFEVPVYENIREIGMAKLAKMMEYVVIQGGTSMNVYFPDFRSMIQIGSGFDVVVFSEHQKFLSSVETLVHMEGLCMRANSAMK